MEPAPASASMVAPRPGPPSAPPPTLPPLTGAAGLLLRLPLLLAGTALLLPLLLTAAILVARMIIPNGPLATTLAGLKSAPLVGMQNAAPAPGWPGAGLFNGAWQAPAEAWWNMHLPLRGPVVRATNQLYYSLFRKSYMYGEQIVIGREQTLYEQRFLYRYCNTDRHPFTAAQFDRWAAGIKQIEDYFRQRGQGFIYMLSPFKATIHPQLLPPGLACDEPRRPEYTLAVAALARAGVHTLDASRLLLAARGQYPAELLFPRGGTHWTMLGVGLSMLELARLSPQAGGPPLPVPEFSYRVTRTPLHDDADLLNLLNLWHPDGDYPVPDLRIAPVPAGTTPAPRLALVGTSFLVQPMEFFTLNGEFSEIDHYYYFALAHHRYANHAWVSGPGSFQAPKNYDALFAADLVVLEESEAQLDSEHARRLRALLESNVAPAQQAPIPRP